MALLLLLPFSIVMAQVEVGVTKAATTSSPYSSRNYIVPSPVLKQK
jgi:hypothetical protein